MLLVLMFRRAVTRNLHKLHTSVRLYDKLETAPVLM